MTKATEAKLAELHGAVADALTTVVKVEEPSAAHIMAAITFLKNNNITADAESNAALSELSKQLAEKRKTQKGKLSPESLQEAAAVFERDLPGFIQ